MKTANYNIRIDPAIKMEAEKTFAAFGLNLSEAINIFLHKSIMVNGLPFDVREPRPSAALLEAMDETERLIAQYADGKRTPPAFANADEMFAAMDLEDELESENA